MSTLVCTFDEFKRTALEFHRAAPTLNRLELDNAWQCLGLAYLGMNQPMWQQSAAIVLQMQAQARVARERELDEQELRDDPNFHSDDLLELELA